MVPPSESKLFRISKTPEPVVVFQENDFTLNSDGEKVKVPKKFILEKVAETKKNNKTENGLIVVELKLDLNVETVLSPEELLEESKTKSTFRIIGDIVTNIKNKLNCQTAKKDFNKNLKEIGEIFDSYVKPPAMYENEEQEDAGVNVYTHTVNVTPEMSIIKNKVVPKGTKVEFEPEKLEKLPEKKEKEEKKGKTKDFKCDICGKTYKNAIGLNKHKQKRHSNLSPPSQDQEKLITADTEPFIDSQSNRSSKLINEPTEQLVGPPVRGGRKTLKRYHRRSGNKKNKSLKKIFKLT